MIYKKLLSEIHSRQKLNISLIEKAYFLAKKAHLGQKRKNGDPFLCHPIEVAFLVCISGGNENMICSALLHDVIEDTSVTFFDIEKIMGTRIAQIVKILSKPKSWESGFQRTQTNLKQIIKEFQKYPEALIVKMADRTHNIKTVSFLSPEKQKEYFEETRKIFLPLCRKMSEENLFGKYGTLLKTLFVQLLSATFEKEEQMKFNIQEMPSYSTNIPQKNIHSPLISKLKKKKMVYFRQKILTEEGIRN